MAFRIHDLPRTTRRARGGEPPRLFPRLLGDERLDPRIDLAIRFLEGNLGRRRGELDGGALVELLGDPRLARCLIGCLSQSYRYMPRHLADLLGAERAAALAARGLATPADLRALAYARANTDEHGGFVAPHGRPPFLTALAPEVAPDEVERALWLDAPDQAVLVRVGPPPTAAEVRALYNPRALEAVLTAAVTATLGHRGEVDQIERVARRHGVEVVFERETVTLHGRRDALGSWARHGGRLARTALTLLTAGALGPGTATVHAAGEEYRVALDRALLRKALPARGWVAPAATWPAVEELVQAARQGGALTGWRLLRWPPPLATTAGAAWPEFALVRGPLSIGLLPMPTEEARRGDRAALADLADRRLCLLLSDAPRARPLAGEIVLPLSGPDAVEALAAALDRLWHGSSGARGGVGALAEAARAAGWLAESELAARLECEVTQVGTRLARLASDDIVYIAGFGLCATTLLDRASAVVQEEVANNGGRLELGRVGRRLHALVGRNEGLHALIGHLAGELRPVA